MARIENTRTVTLDGRRYRIFGVRVLIGTADEAVVTAAEHALEKHIQEMIADERYHECIDIDHQYAYYLPEEVNPECPEDVAESIENGYSFDITP